MTFSNELKNIIIKILMGFSENPKNNDYIILPDEELSKISLVETKSPKEAKHICKEIYSLRLRNFRKSIDQLDIERILDINIYISLYLNIIRFADFLNIKFNLKLKNRDEIFLDAALNGSPNYKHSTSAIKRKGFENTSISSFSNDIYI